MYMVMSFDGVVALDSARGISGFSSPEDKKFFLKGAKKCSAVIMGKNTAAHYVKGPVNFVLSHSAEAADGASLKEQKSKDGDSLLPRRVYISGSAREVYNAIESQGHKKAALLGGPSTNIQFLKEGLVDEIFLTVEPVTIGEGIHFLEGAMQSRWILCKTKRLNKRGTLVLHYKKSSGH